jgi:hypothetical protein
MDRSTDVRWKPVFAIAAICLAALLWPANFPTTLDDLAADWR